jgi:protein Mpv17
MAITLLGPDSLLSSTADTISKVSQELDVQGTYENTIHILQNSDNAIIKKWKLLLAFFKKLGNSYRIFNITIINYSILSMFGYLLVKLTFRYHKLYTRSSILATIATNVVLYGISDTCAQSITQFLAGRRINNSDFTHTNSSRYTDGGIRITLNNNSGIDLNGSNVFVDYGDGEGEIGINHDFNVYDIENNNENTAYTIHDERENFNFRRWFGFITWGFIMAFIQVAWYMFLNAMFTDMPSIVSVLERDLTDQLLFSPLSLASFFAFTTMVIEGGDVQTYKDKMFKLYVTTLAVSFSVWFPVQFINFSIMPKKFQVPFSSSVGVLWNCFLSYRNALASKQ